MGNQVSVQSECSFFRSFSSYKLCVFHALQLIKKGKILLLGDVSPYLNYINIRFLCTTYCYFSYNVDLR